MSKHRPPTKRMIEKLRDCYEKQVKSGDGLPCLEEDIKGSLAGLYKRGYVETKMHEINGKKLLSLFVTEGGKKFLEETQKKNTD